jgi:hypothetical protein
MIENIPSAKRCDVGCQTIKFIFPKWALSGPETPVYVCAWNHAGYSN